ncbi:hypothetical protein GOBAR_AA10774 [Gossypium barbadense]|uniref:Uncharacterized protein n=1 Tax=Gossypium barbadense TaxID=3634 RepID=A0A2P5Y2N5_GOSBA|nr:hypothetical protein GOBAR_AA10774 [Gossypium barbadense]
MVVSILYIDSQSTVRRIDIDLNVAPKADTVGDNGCSSSDLSDHEVDSNNDPYVDKVPDDIEDEGVNDDRNANFSKYSNILPTHRLAVDFDSEELFVG